MSIPTSSPSETTPLVTSNIYGTSTRPFTLRRARFSDLAPAARACSLAFWDDVLFGRLIHPHRHTYPRDVDKYWYRRFVVDWWDRSHVFVVTTETVPLDGDGGRGAKPRTGEIVTGLAHWSRIAPSWRENYSAGWGLAWWDLSKCHLPYRFVRVYLSCPLYPFRSMPFARYPYYFRKCTLSFPAASCVLDRFLWRGQAVQEACPMHMPLLGT